MSLLSAPGTYAPTTPYAVGERVALTGPDGAAYQARVEAISPRAEGFALVAAITAPRKARNRLVTTVVDATGYGPYVSPMRPLLAVPATTAMAGAHAA